MAWNRKHKPENMVKRPEVGKEYYYWDPVEGRIDEGLAKVVSVRENGEVDILNLYTAKEETLNWQGLEWELNPNDGDAWEKVEA